MAAYYNEIDPYAAEWLRNLIKAGHIADGEVDTRSIIDVQPDDIRHFDQCHFFAGIAGWSHALRLAGWADDRKIWTGSCPCQPFSVAGKGKGTDDERHLWPHFFRLIRGCRPPVVMGEQVAGASGYGWLDGVRSDLESEGYAIDGVDIPACAANAPHIRSRLYWISTDMANAQSIGRRQGTEDIRGLSEGNREEGTTRRFTVNNYSFDMADASNEGSQGRLRGWQDTQRQDLERHARCDGAAYSGDDMANAKDIYQFSDCGIRTSGNQRGESQRLEQFSGCDGMDNMANADGEQLRGGHAGEPVSPSGSDEGEAWQRERIWPDAGADGNSFWRNAIWLNGADGKTRRAEPNICLLAHGVPARVGKLRAYGNAIVPPLAAEVIKAFMESQ